MEGTKKRAVYKKEPVYSFKELLKMVDLKYSNNVAYKYTKEVQRLQKILQKERNK